MRRNITNIALILLLIPLSCNLAGRTAAQGPPTDFHDAFEIAGICEFTVMVELNGKAKTIELNGERTIFTSPGLTATLTNLDDPASETTIGITGAFHQTIRGNGDTEFVVTGRNLLIGVDPEAAFVLTIGTFSFTFDPAFNVVGPLTGNGQVINVCELLS
ncbi:MAG TPA: hypothetical protein VJ124_16385 [Pyrinomonadaceae bacterium]|nr:hypothetical protein [Pyrinomonadaceae bacterium]